MIVEGSVSNKKEILRVAKSLFAKKGFENTRICDIASTVGVSDSTLYEHYKNKEDILFSIPEENIQGLIKINTDHIRGLVGPEVILRKLIWNCLDYLVADREYTSLLLFELRANRGFYHKDNLKLFREFLAPYHDAIIEGQEDGRFRNGIRPSLILHLIFGTIESILTTWLRQNNPSDPLAWFEDFFDLLINAIKRKETVSATLDKRKLILNAAAEILSQVGHQKARIQDIAKLAGVGDATIYSYFRSKEEILFELPLESTLELIEIQKEHLEGPKSPDFKLELLIRDHLRFVEAHKQYNIIRLFDLRHNEQFYQTKAYALFRKYSHTFYDAIREGIESNKFRSTVNPYIATRMIFGFIDHVMISWIISGRPQKLTHVSDQICELVLSCLKP